MDEHPLRRVLEAAARGEFPPADGVVDVLPSPPGPSDAVVAFTAHHVVASEATPEEVVARLPGGDLTAPMSAGFLAWLGERLGSAPGSLDLVLAARGTGTGPGRDLVEIGDREHDRVARAQRYRREVRVWGDPERAAVLILGRGLAHRLELSLEIDPARRGRGLGRRLIAAGLGLAEDGQWVFAQVAPGNAASVRAFLAAGFTPIGGEVLFLRGART